MLGEKVFSQETFFAKEHTTMNLTECEMQVLDELCARKGTNKTALMRQALRLHQAVDTRLEQYDTLIFENAE